MQANTNGENVKSFFEKNLHLFKRMKNEEYLPCNCPSYEHIENIFTVDHSNKEKPKIIFIDSNTHQVISADKLGCYCDAVLNGGIINDSLPISNIATDVNKIYWANGSNKTIYFVDKNNKILLNEKTNGNNFLLHGTHVQPFPLPKCLIPQLHLQTIIFHSKTPDSITLLLPEIKLDDECNNVSMASIKFTIFYKKYTDANDKNCNNTCIEYDTFDRRVKITGLQPYSKYIFAVSIKNYFTELQGIQSIVGPSQIFQTAPGAPSKPQNVTAVVLNPTMVEVKWLPPQELNGESVLYEVHWLTEGIDGVRQKGEQIVSRDKDTMNSLNKIPKYKVKVLTKLTPNQVYTLWVRAHSENNETHSDSNTISVRTYPEPNDFVLLNSSSTTLAISWKLMPDVKQYLIQYSLVNYNEWKTISNGTKEETLVINVRSLSPKMKYKFQMKLKYLDYTDWFVWPQDQRYVFETLGKPNKKLHRRSSDSHLPF